MLQLDASLVGLPAHPRENVVVEHIVADLGLVGLCNVLVALARVAQNLRAVFLLVFVEAGHRAPVRDKHGHGHFEQSHHVAVFIRQFNPRQLGVHGCRDDGGVSCPASPLLVSQTVASELDQNDLDAVFFREVAGLVVDLGLVQEHVGIVPVRHVSVCEFEQFLSDLCASLSSFCHQSSFRKLLMNL